MKDSDPDNVLAQRVWVMQFVVILLMVGVLVFFGIAVFIRNGPNPPKAALNPPALTFLGMGCAVLAAVLHFLIPPLYVAVARNQIAKGTWKPSAPKSPSPTDQLAIGWVVLMAVLDFIVSRLSAANPSTPEKPLPAEQ